MKQVIKPILIILVGLLSLVTLVVLVCGFALAALSEEIREAEATTSYECSPDNPENKIEENGAFEFPPSARIVVSDCVLSGNVGWVQFEMLSNEVDAFLSSTYIAELSPEIESPYPYNNKVKSRLSEMSSYLFGNGGPIEYYQEILIDTSDPDWYVVYLYYQDKP